MHLVDDDAEPMFHVLGYREIGIENSGKGQIEKHLEFLGYRNSRRFMQRFRAPSTNPGLIAPAGPTVFS
jgi:hypothetical protein